MSVSDILRGAANATSDKAALQEAPLFVFPSG